VRCALKETICFRQVPCCLLLAALFLLATAPKPALAQDELIVLKDSVEVGTDIRGANTARGASTGWLPSVKFTVRGKSIPSGGQFWVNFGYAAKRQWLKFDCKDPDDVFNTEDQWSLFCSPGRIEGTRYLGLVDFQIHIRNPLTETDMVLFKGKFKVAKDPVYPEDYYVDEDWRFPIGYVLFDRGNLAARYWLRGDVPKIQAHLFYQGKEIATASSSGFDAGEWSGEPYKWGYTQIQFSGVYFDKNPGYMGPEFLLQQNPGEYEVKILRARQLARSFKFTVLPDGTIDNSIATANKVGSDLVLVPVRVIGTLEKYNKLAWKTDAFYGNPMTGFTAPP